MHLVRIHPNEKIAVTPSRSSFSLGRLGFSDSNIRLAHILTSLVRIDVSFPFWTPLTSVSFPTAAMAQPVLRRGGTGVPLPAAEGCDREPGLLSLMFGPRAWRRLLRLLYHTERPQLWLTVQLTFPKAFRIWFYVLIFQIRKQTNPAHIKFSRVPGCDWNKGPG